MTVVRKCGAATVSFYLPENMNKAMDAYIAEGRFLKNWNAKAKARIQNMGENALNDWPKTAALICDLDPD
eukprot:9814371-Ditylum_brightwellii.AAC.1